MSGRLNEYWVQGMTYGRLHSNRPCARTAMCLPKVVIKQTAYIRQPQLFRYKPGACQIIERTRAVLFTCAALPGHQAPSQPL